MFSICRSWWWSCFFLSPFLWLYYPLVLFQGKSISNEKAKLLHALASTTFFLSVREKLVLLNFCSCTTLTFLMPWCYSSIRMFSFICFASFLHFVYIFFRAPLWNKLSQPQSDHMITFLHFSILKIACFLLQFILLF